MISQSQMQNRFMKLYYISSRESMRGRLRETEWCQLSIKRRHNFCIALDEN